MKLRGPISRRSMLVLLHPVFALTAVADAMTGPLLPSLAHAFHLSDSQAGLFLFWIFAGMATGALLCRGNYAHLLTGGLLAMTCSCLWFQWVPRTMLFPFAFLFGVSVGMPMTAISLFAGRNYPARRASTLTLLNLTWSAGAMLAPLIAARLLAVASWRAVYVVLACASGLACAAAGFAIRDSPETARAAPQTAGFGNLRMIALFAVFFFLEVGVETTFGAWISTYVLRMTLTSVTLAAAATAIYWTGFLASRGLSPLVMLRMRPGRLLQLSLIAALGAAILLTASRSPLLLAASILLLGATLAPIFPVALAAFFDRARHSSDTRFVIALSGYGGSAMPWLVGWISTHAGGLRIGLLAGPAALLVMTAMLPWLGVSRGAAAAGSNEGIQPAEIARP